MGLFDIDIVPCGSCQLHYNENPHNCDAPDFCPCGHVYYHTNKQIPEFIMNKNERRTLTMKVIQVELPEDVPDEKMDQLADTYRILADAACPTGTVIKVKVRFGKLNTSL